MIRKYHFIMNRKINIIKINLIIIVEFIQEQSNLFLLTFLSFMTNKLKFFTKSYFVIHFNSNIF